MIKWTCVYCGSVEQLHFLPDRCSSCGGPMETQDGRSTASGFCEDVTNLYAQRGELAEQLRLENWAKEAIADFDAELAAASDEPAAVIRLWQRGGVLTPAQREIIDDALASNRFEMLMGVYGQAAA
jgi:hypothetical protein